MTSRSRQRLRVTMVTHNGAARFSEFSNFVIASANDKYRLLSVGTYDGTRG